MNNLYKEKSSNTEFEIKKAALSYIAQYGYEKTTLKSIAKTVGIKTPSIYSHFESKEQLFISILKDLRAQDRERLMQLVLSLRGKSVEGAIKKLFYYYTNADNIVFWNIALKEILMQPSIDIVQSFREDFTQIEKDISVQLTEFLGLGMKEGKIKENNMNEMVSLFFTLIDGLLIEQTLYDDEKYNARRDEIWRLYWQIIAI